jgi:hypothetical protein
MKEEDHDGEIPFARVCPSFVPLFIYVCLETRCHGSRGCAICARLAQ